MLTFSKETFRERSEGVKQNKEEDAEEKLEGQHNWHWGKQHNAFITKKCKIQILSFRKKGPFDRMLMRGACLNGSTSEVMLMEMRMSVTMGMSSWFLGSWVVFVIATVLVILILQVFVVIVIIVQQVGPLVRCRGTCAYAVLRQGGGDFNAVSFCLCFSGQNLFSGTDTHVNMNVVIINVMSLGYMSGCLLRRKGKCKLYYTVIESKQAWNIMLS